MSPKTRIKKFLTDLEKRLAQKNMSIAQFSEKMGVSRKIVYLWLTGDVIMSLDKYFLALKILDMEEEKA